MASSKPVTVVTRELLNSGGGGGGTGSGNSDFSITFSLSAADYSQLQAQIRMTGSARLLFAADFESEQHARGTVAFENAGCTVPQKRRREADTTSRTAYAAIYSEHKGKLPLSSPVVKAFMQKHDQTEWSMRKLKREWDDLNPGMKQAQAQQPHRALSEFGVLYVERQGKVFGASPAIKEFMTRHKLSDWDMRRLKSQWEAARGLPDGPVVPRFACQYCGTKFVRDVLLTRHIAQSCHSEANPLSDAALQKELKQQHTVWRLLNAEKQKLCAEYSDEDVLDSQPARLETSCALNEINERLRVVIASLTALEQKLKLRTDHAADHNSLLSVSPSAPTATTTAVAAAAAVDGGGGGGGGGGGAAAVVAIDAPPINRAQHEERRPMDLSG